MGQGHLVLSQRMIFQGYCPDLRLNTALCTASDRALTCWAAPAMLQEDRMPVWKGLTHKADRDIHLEFAPDVSQCNTLPYNLELR